MEENFDRPRGRDWLRTHRSRVNKCTRKGRVMENLERGRGRMRTKNNCKEVRQSVVGNLEIERSRENESAQRIAAER